MANEAENYMVWIAKYNMPRTNIFMSLYQSVLSPDVIATSSPIVPLKDLVLNKICNVTYVNVGLTNHTINYPKLSSVGRPRLLNQINYLGGINEINKLDLTKYFGAISPKYATIDMHDYNEVANQWHQPLIELCNRIVQFNLIDNSQAAAIKYYDGMWGMGTTFVIVPSKREWNPSEMDQMTKNSHFCQ